MTEPSVEQVFREALRQCQKQTHPYVAAKQARSEHNRYVSAQVTKMVPEKRKEWSTIGSLNDLTLAIVQFLMTMMAVSSKATSQNLRSKASIDNLPLDPPNPLMIRTNMFPFWSVSPCCLLRDRLYANVTERTKSFDSSASFRAPVANVCLDPHVHTGFCDFYLDIPSSPLVLVCPCVQSCSNCTVIMSYSLEQWIKRIPEMSDDDIKRLQQALDKENRQRHDRRIFQLFSKECIHAGQDYDDDEISDFSEESPGEFAGAISQGIHKLMHSLQGWWERLIRKALQTWKSAKRSRSFAVSLKKPISCITID